MNVFPRNRINAFDCPIRDEVPAARTTAANFGAPCGPSAGSLDSSPTTTGFSSFMTIHRVRQLGDPILRTRSAAVEDPGSPAVRVVLDDLKETLRDTVSRQGMGRAMAAPQIGAPLSLIYVEITKPWVLMNPEIVDVGNEDFSVWDDCFSFPSLMVRVQRAYRITIRYQDLRGQAQTADLEGALAELVQHEIDHLQGVLAVDRPTGLDPFCLREEWNKHYAFLGRYGTRSEAH